MIVRAIPRDRSYEREIGESQFCRNFSPHGSPRGCEGGAEIEITFRETLYNRRGNREQQNVHVVLCRACTSDLMDLLREATDLWDGRDLLSMGRES